MYQNSKNIYKCNDRKPNSCEKQLRSEYMKLV